MMDKETGSNVVTEKKQRVLVLTLLVVLLILLQLWQFFGNSDSLSALQRSFLFPIDQGRDLQWEEKSHGSGIWNSYVTLPLDYSDPKAGHVRIALAKLPAKVPEQQKLGSLFVSVGLPGDSGTRALYEMGPQIMDIVDGRYDLIGFDPRGVNRTSNHFSCFPHDILQKEQFYRGDGVENKTWSKTRGKICSDSDLGAQYISTTHTVTDLLRIIRILGEEKLNFIGSSYGSVIGHTFAMKSPKHVGRMILDGVVDMGKYSRTGQIFDWGRSENNYPQEVGDLLRELEKTGPIQVSDRANGSLVTNSMVKHAFYSAITSPQQDWEKFLSACHDLLYFKDGSEFLSSQWPSKFDPESSGYEAGYVTTCNDSQNCDGYSANPSNALQQYMNNNGNKLDIPVLILGTSQDPYASLDNSIKLSKQYTRPSLVQQDNYGHGAFSNLTPATKMELSDWLLKEK